MLTCTFFHYFHVVISKHLRLDKGSETGHMATIHAFLSQRNEGVQSHEGGVHFGPSTNNKVRKQFHCYPWFINMNTIIRVSSFGNIDKIGSNYD